MSEAPEVLIRVEGEVGRITLNRPQALHALTTNMCREMIAALTAWRIDPAVKLVLMDHSGERGFCAGGDIRMLAESARGDGVLNREFFFTEYQLDSLLFHYPKHVVAIMDGTVMGGGVGIARPCRFRVGTERTVFAMPETGIGLFPDVGGSWYLSRMPDHIGTWIALTGARLKAADCELTGIITDYVESKDIEELKASIIANPDLVRLMVDMHRLDSRKPPLVAHLRELGRCFSRPTVETILNALDVGSEWAREQASAIRSKSPTSQKAALQQLQLGAKARTFDEVLAMEYRIARRLAVGRDFLEGVRAVILDKDNAPKWSPATLEAVSHDHIEAVFAPLPADEEWSPLQGELA
jgi:enoyl-CoA hydratase